MGKITLLEVPFAEKNQVKALGGRWDAKKRKWFVPERKDLTPFSRVAQFCVMHAIKSRLGLTRP
jgi:hypothetical protein